MYGRQIAGGAQGGCKHLVRYVSSKVCTDHACKQARRSTSSRQPRELHTCISDSKWRAMKALNLDNFAAYSEVAFKSRKREGDCSINVIKDDVSKETPCIINIYLKSSEEKRRENYDVKDNKKKREAPWEEINTSKTSWVKAQTKLFTPRNPAELDANILRSKLLAVKIERHEQRLVEVERHKERHVEVERNEERRVEVERNEERRVEVERNEERQTKSSEPPKGECQEVYAQGKLLCYNVSVYNCKTTRSAMEYQGEDNSKETTMSKMIDLAYKQPEASGISRLLSFCRKMLTTDVKAHSKNETRVDTTGKYKVAQVFRLYPAAFAPATATIKPRISPRTLSDFKVFKAPGFDKQVCRLQRCHFSSKSNTGKEGEKEAHKKKNCSILDQYVNKILAVIKKRCFGEAKKATREAPPPVGEAKDAKKTSREAPPPELKTSGKDACLEKSLARVREISPPVGEVKDAKITTRDAPPVERKTSGKDACLEKSLARVREISPPSAGDGAKAKVQIDKKEEKSNSKPVDASKKDTFKEKGAWSEKQTAKDDDKVKVGEKPKKICSRQSPLPLDASKKEKPKEGTKEKGAESASDCKKDPPSKQDSAIYAKDAQAPTCQHNPTSKPPAATKPPCDASKKETCTDKFYIRCAKKATHDTPETAKTKSCETVESEKAKKMAKIFVDKRCIQDGDTPKEELEGAEKEGGSYGGKGGKRDPCKKYRIMWQEKMAAKKKESCSPENVLKRDICSQTGVKYYMSRRNMSKKGTCSDGGSDEKSSKQQKDCELQEDASCKEASKKDTCSSGGGSKKDFVCPSAPPKDTCARGEGKDTTCAVASKNNACYKGGKRDGKTSESKDASSGAGGTTSRECASRKKICSKGGSVEEASTSKEDPHSQDGAEKRTPGGDASKKDPCSHGEAKEKTSTSKGGASVSKKDPCSQAGAKGDASKKDPCSHSEAKEKTSATKAGDTCVGASKKDTCSQGEAKGDASKKDPCSQSGTKEKTSASKGGDTCASASQKDTCSQGGAKKDTCSQGGAKKVTCSQGGAKKDTCSQGGPQKDTCQEGAKKETPKKDTCSQGGGAEKATSKKNPCSKSVTSTSKKDSTSASATKKDACSRGGTKGDTPSGGAAKKDTCSQGTPKKETGDSCSGGKRSPAGTAKTKDDCDKFTATKKEGVSGVCNPIIPKDEEHEHNKCEEDSDEVVDQRYATVVEAWHPPHDIMDALGSLLDETNEDEIDEYYGDSHPNHMYYMYTREFFYDVNAMLQPCRRPQPVAPLKGKGPIKTEDSCGDD